MSDVPTHLNVAMEDAHVTILNLEENAVDKNTFFAVYDGHGGKLSPFFVHCLLKS